MSLKKIFILPGLFILSHILYIGCCQCEDASKSYYKLNALWVNARGSEFAVIDTGAVTYTDSIYLTYSMLGNCTAGSTMINSLLVNQAQACKCAGCGDLGLKTKVAGVSLTSDHPYNGIPAGSPLNSIFTIADVGGTNQVFLPLDSLPALLNTNSTRYTFTTFTTVKPGNTQGHLLRLTLRLQDGQDIYAESKKIFWQ